MVTVGKSHGDPMHLPTSEPVGSNSPPSKRDLASWWKQFKRSTRRDGELKGGLSIKSSQDKRDRANLPCGPLGSESFITLAH